MSFTQEEIEAIDAISHEYICWGLQAEGRVPWLTDEERTAVGIALQEPDAEKRYQAVLDVIESVADNLATADFLKEKAER